MLNSYAKADMWDGELMLHLARAALLIPPTDYSTQAMVLIVTAISRAAGGNDENSRADGGNSDRDNQATGQTMGVHGNDRKMYIDSLPGDGGFVRAREIKEGALDGQRGDSDVWRQLREVQVVEYVAEVREIVLMLEYDMYVSACGYAQQPHTHTHT
jgi:hypothetical protein